MSELHENEKDELSERLKEYIEEQWESFKSVSLNHGFEIDEENEGEAFVIFMCGVLSGVKYPCSRFERAKEEVDQ